MKKRFFLLMLALASLQFSLAQCAMCAATVETHTKGGGGTALTLNDGIVYLLLMPWTFAALIGYLWYRSYKRRKHESEQELSA